LSVASFFDMYHSLTLAPISLVDSPNWEFRLAVAKLPLVYEGNEGIYRNFLMEYGTHYIDTVSMGALSS